MTLTLLLLMFLIVISYAAAGFNLTENIQPWQCSSGVLNYEFQDSGGTYYNIRIRPESFPNTSFPKFCQLIFTALEPWDDMMFSFSYCENGIDGPCGGDSTKYSYISVDSVTYALYDEHDGKEIYSFNQSSLGQFSNSSEIFNLKSSNVSVVISGNDNPSKEDWAFFFRMRPGRNSTRLLRDPEDYEFSYASLVFTVALGGTVAIILLIVLFCCLCKMKSGGKNVKPVLRNKSNGYGAIPSEDDDDQLTNENTQHIVRSTEQQLFSDPAVIEKPSHHSSVKAKQQSRDLGSVYPNYGFVSDKSSILR